MLGSRATPEGSPRAWPIPAAFDATRLAGGRVLFAGDAAGVVDPLTGEGIAQALQTAMLAAGAVAAGGPPAAVRDRYRHDVDRALGTDLRLARHVQRVLRSERRTRVAMRARRYEQLDPPQLRPLDVRGLPARARAHAPTVVKPGAAPGVKIVPEVVIINDLDGHARREVSASGTDDIANAVRWAVDTAHVNMINMSFGEVKLWPQDEAAITYAESKGVVVCFGELAGQ